MIKRTITTLPLLLAFVMAGFTVGHAQEAKIGYVDPQAILTKMPEMKAVQQRMQNFISDKQAEIQTMRQEFQTAIQQYQQQMAVLSEEAKKKKEEQLGERQAKIRQAQRKAQQEIRQKQQELVQPLLQSINNAIKEVANEKGLDYVLNTTTSNGDVIILYASETAKNKYNITDEVMDKLGI